MWIFRLPGSELQKSPESERVNYFKKSSVNPKAIHTWHESPRSFQKAFLPSAMSPQMAGGGGVGGWWWWGESLGSKEYGRRGTLPWELYRGNRNFYSYFKLQNMFEGMSKVSNCTLREFPGFAKIYTCRSSLRKLYRDESFNELSEVIPTGGLSSNDLPYIERPLAYPFIFGNCFNLSKNPPFKLLGYLYTKHYNLSSRITKICGPSISAFDLSTHQVLW